MGGRARALLLALGGLPRAPIAIGGRAMRGVGIGGLVDWMPAGGAANARHYAQGGFALATHANDAATTSYVAADSFISTARHFMEHQLLVNVCVALRVAADLPAYR